MKDEQVPTRGTIVPSTSYTLGYTGVTLGFRHRVGIVAFSTRTVRSSNSDSSRLTGIDSEP